MKEVVLQEIQKYGRGTTLRMVPRIFKGSGIARVVWLTAFLLCLSIMLWNVTMIFTDYFRWPVNSIFKEGTGRPLFPDVTICNKYLTVYSSAMRMKWEDYINMTSAKKRMFPYNIAAKFVKVTPEDYEYIWSLIQSPSGYLSSLPISDFYSENILSNFITFYKYADWSGFKRRINISHAPAWSPDFGACYTVQTSKTDASKVRALSLILYINNLPDILFSQLRNFPDSNNIDAAGVRVIVHAPGSKPNPFTGVDVGPGTKTTLHVSNIERSRQSWPYGKCTKQKYLDEPRNLDQYAAELYTKDACYEVCLQSSIVEKCGCVTGFLQSTRRQQDMVNGVICGNQSQTSDVENMDGFKQLVCMYSVNLDTEWCESQCADPCEEHQYDVATTSAPWPHVATQLSFYTKYVAPIEKSLMRGDRFQVYQSLLESNSTPEQVIKELKEIHLLEENFVSLTITFGKNYPMLLSETPSYQPEMVLSQIGGTLAVWIGMSVENVIEWFALIAAVLSALSKQKRKISLIPDNKSNVREVPSIESCDNDYSKSRERGEYSNSCETGDHTNSNETTEC